MMWKKVTAVLMLTLVLMVQPIASAGANSVVFENKTAPVTMQWDPPEPTASGLTRACYIMCHK